MSVFERFTDQARRVVVMAQEEARLLNHNYIGTEHILLGLFHAHDNVVAVALGRSGVTLQRARASVDGIVGHGRSAPSGHIPFTPRAKKVLELAFRESSEHGDHHIGTEHLLLGLLREGEGVGVQALDRLGVDVRETRHAVIETMRDAGHADETRRYSAQVGTSFTREPIVRCPGCDFEINLVRAPQEVCVRMERSDGDPRFRMYLAFAGLPEHLVHECEPEASTP